MKKSLCLLIIAICLFPCNVFAAGKHVNRDYSNFSNVLIVGDSRIGGLSRRMQDYPKGRYSVNAVYGGHYEYLDAYMQGEYTFNPVMITAHRSRSKQGLEAVCGDR